MNSSPTGGWHQRCGGFPSWNEAGEGPGEVQWVGGLQCVQCRGWSLLWVSQRLSLAKRLCPVCTANSQQGGSKKDLLKLFYEPFILSYSSCCVPLPLSSDFSSSSHPQRGWFCLRIRWSPCSSPKCPWIVFCSPGQSVVSECVGGIIPFLISSSPRLLPPWTSQALISCRGGQNLLIMRRTCELDSGGTPSGPEESQRGWAFLFCFLISELREKFCWVEQKISKSRGL